MLGAARVGERELLELGEEVGWDALERYVADWFDYSEQRMRATIRALPAGASHRRTTHDPVPGVASRTASRSRSRSPSTPRRREIEVDLRDNPDCLPCGLNLTEATSPTPRR